MWVCKTLELRVLSLKSQRILRKRLNGRVQKGLFQKMDWMAIDYRHQLQRHVRILDPPLNLTRQHVPFCLRKLWGVFEEKSLEKQKPSKPTPWRSKSYEPTGRTTKATSRVWSFRPHGSAVVIFKPPRPLSPAKRKAGSTERGDGTGKSFVEILLK